MARQHTKPDQKENWRKGKMSLAGFRFFWKPAVRLMIWIFHFAHVEGIENLPKEDGFLICSNHRGALDPLAIASYMKKCPYFMAKEELFHIPLLGALVRYGHAFPVKRGASDIASVQESVRLLKEKENLLVFPEGTRSKTGIPLPPKTGVALLAAKSGCAVLPVAICAAPGIGFPFKPMTIKIGKLISNEELRLNEGRHSVAYTAAVNLIMERIVEMLPPVKGKKLVAAKLTHKRGRLTRKVEETKEKWNEHRTERKENRAEKRAVNQAEKEQRAEEKADRKKKNED